MAGCNSITLAGLQAECVASKGGIVKVWMAPYEGVTVTGDSDKTAGTVSGGEWAGYNFKKNTGSLTSTLNKDEENGVSYFTNELTLRFNRLDQEKRAEIMSLALGEMAVLVKDANGKYWYVTSNGYMSATATTAQTGQQATDGSRYELTLSSETPLLPFEIAESDVKTLVGAAYDA